MAKHRAWRVKIDHTVYRDCIVASRISFFETPDGVDVTQGAGGTPISHNDGYSPTAGAFDTDGGTSWHDSCGFGGNGWVGYDFGADETKWKDVRGFQYMPRNDNLANQDSMRSGGLEYSDDLITWTRLFDAIETTNWSSGDFRTKSFWGKIDNMQDAGGYRYVRLRCTGLTGDDGYNGFSKVEFFNAAGEQVGFRLNDSANGRRTLLSYFAQAGSIHSTTEVGNPSDGLIQFSTQVAETYAIYDFGPMNKVRLSKLRMYPNRDKTSRTWTGIAIEGSNDGTTWATIDNWSTDPWVTGQWQQRVITTAPDATVVPGAHRYWRVRNVYTTGNPFALADLIFCNEDRTPVGTGTYTASSTYSGDNIYDYSVGNLQDGNLNTLWAAASTDAWVTIDYGAPVDPKVLRLTARNDSQNSANQAPMEFLIQYSDDGAFWVTLSLVEAAAQWTPGETRHFKLYFDSYRVGFDSVNTGVNRDAYVSLSELRWLDLYGEPYDTPPYDSALLDYDYGTSRDIYGSSNPKGLFDGATGQDDGTSAIYFHGNTGDDRYFVHRMPKGTDLRGIAIWSRNDQNAVNQQSPSRIRISRSTDNGLTYQYLGTAQMPTFTAPFQRQEALFRATSAPPKLDRWRLRVLDTYGQNITSIVELEWRTTVGGTQAAVGGAVLENATLTSYAGSYAYDGVTQTSTEQFWVGNGVGASIGYQWENATYIAEYVVYARDASNFATQNPRSWVVEYSEDNGLTWVAVDYRYGQDGWQAGVGRVFTILPNTVPTAERHRYWRLNFDARNAYTGMRQIRMKDENGVDLSPGTMNIAVQSTGSITVTEGKITNLLSDGSNEYVYSHNNSQNSLIFDYGSNPREVVSYDIVSRISYSNNDGPRAWYLEWSDDGATWTKVSRIGGQENYIDNTTRSYKSQYTAWRLMFESPGMTGYSALADLEFRTSPGGADVTTDERGRVLSNIWDSGYASTNAFNNNVNDFFYVTSSQFNNAAPPFIGFRFDDDIELTEIVITPRQDGYAGNDTPWEMNVAKTVDGGMTWQVRGYFLNLGPWTAAPRTLTIPEQVVGFARTGRAGLYVAEGPVDDGAAVFRQGLYVAEGPKNGAAVFRQGLYIVEGPVNEEEDDEAKLYRPRQFFIN